ncbi:MAG TPA: DAK2 domain-containing protein, partial [Acidimicrobiia bacterium]
IKSAFVRFDELITTYRTALNGLNVYPVPDGDTGSNMSGTIKRVMAELDGTDSMREVTNAIAHGSLMGAKGNSGILLSVILSGLAETFSDHLSIDVPQFKEGLARASASAYRAVATPVEGTILSVIRETSEEAAADGYENLTEMADAVFRRAVDALARTPDALPILKQAQVVDAGGAGLVLLFAAFAEIAAVDVVELPHELLTAEAHLDQIDSAPPVSELRYEVMFFLDSTEEGMEAFRERWAELGDSIAVVGGNGTWNCHIHTDEIGPAIEAGIAVGAPSDIRVTDLTESPGVLEAEEIFLPRDEVAVAPIGVISVVNGDGRVAVFRDLGVQGIIRGGQSMNPSTEDLLAAVEAMPSKEVILLPNNKNIVPVAEQIDLISPKTVRVVPTRSVPQGITAMLGYTTGSDDIEETAETMAAAASSVMVGEVTSAVRDARVGDLVISKGDWLGLADGAIVVNGPDVEIVLRGLVAELMPPANPEIVTLYTGIDASLPATKSLEAYLSELHPEVELVIIPGGQPTYPYLISVE